MIKCNENNKKGIILTTVVIFIILTCLVYARYTLSVVYSMNSLNLKEIRIHNTEFYRNKIMNKLVDDNYNILFNSFYLDEKDNKLVLEPMYNSQELNKIIGTLNSEDLFNGYISKLIYDNSPMYNSPIVGESNKINCFGLTLLSMSFLDTYYKEEFYYKVITDKKLPHVYLHLYDKQTDEFIRKIDLTVQPKLSTLKEK